jgi:sulfate/thiosulfate transport system substrate-binding protein
MRQHVTTSRPMARRMLMAAGVAAVIATTAACGGSSSGAAPSAAGSGSASDKPAKLALTAYSTPQVAYQELIPAFQKTDAGRKVTFTQSYGASGAQSRAIAAGLPTDVAALSLAPDIDKLVKAGLVDQGWTSGQYKGFVTDSVVVFTVRKGNPKGIKTWDDLAKPGVQVLVPNPFTSGGAKWDVMAAYGAQLEQGRTDAQAVDWLKSFYQNVVAQDKDARSSLQTFTGGKGDVLIGYENEAITAQQKGEAVDYVIPDQTILIQNPVAVISKTKSPDAAKAFVDFLITDDAQKIYASHGYRPVNGALLDSSKFPTPSALFTIDDLGGWSGVNTKFFDPSSGVLAGIEKSLGVTTG